VLWTVSGNPPNKKQTHQSQVQIFSVGNKDDIHCELHALPKIIAALRGIGIGIVGTARFCFKVWPLKELCNLKKNVQI